MKKIINLIVISFLVLSFGCADASRGGMFDGGQAESFSAQDLDGKAVSLDSFIGKDPILLVFFATWCPPCRKEVPELIALNDKYKDKGLRLVATSLDNSSKVLPGFITKNKITYTVWHDGNNEGAQLYEVRGIPTNILIDKTGTIRYREHTPPSEELIESLLE
jgi:peroxiredoxin